MPPKGRKRAAVVKTEKPGEASVVLRNNDEAAKEKECKGPEPVEKKSKKKQIVKEAKVDNSASNDDNNTPPQKEEMVKTRNKRIIETEEHSPQENKTKKTQKKQLKKGQTEVENSAPSNEDTTKKNVTKKRNKKAEANDKDPSSSGDDFQEEIREKNEKNGTSDEKNEKQSPRKRGRLAKKTVEETKEKKPMKDSQSGRSAKNKTDSTTKDSENGETKIENLKQKVETNKPSKEKNQKTDVEETSEETKENEFPKEEDQKVDNLELEEKKTSKNKKIKTAKKGRPPKQKNVDKPEESASNVEAELPPAKTAKKGRPPKQKTIDKLEESPFDGPESKNLPKKTKPKVPDRSILQLKVTLVDTNPPVWRRIQVLNETSFADFAEDIKAAMGWVCGSHHFFQVFDVENGRQMALFPARAPWEIELGFPPNENQKNQNNSTLSDFLNKKGDRTFFDFAADSWLHEVVVEEVLPPPGPKAEFPKCLGGEMACPPEEIGGVEQYNHLMEVIKDPNHEEYEELVVEWLGEMEPGWEPEKFDKNEVFGRVLVPEEN